ncbi:MAG TPA: replication initiation protein [Hymenobacter sp.]|uniref:replication initiation protein n=1 Tax=Hymenobacter sp. TaxID=1898978 RepID=UPI002D7FA886|nr:replication initiation protein [Hymenobacter sp.]HET9504645.1 replication initiation protein [Hymenobacter sp.]
MNNLLSIITPRPEVRQHNALINSSFVLNTLEWRAFTAILARIHPDDEEFKEYFIPAPELVGDETGGSAYLQIKGLAKRLLNRTLYVELLGPNGERVSKPDYEYISFITKARYMRQRGGLFIKVNPEFIPYLLQLTQRGNFTKSLTTELKSLSSSHSFKIYWLLSEYRTFGTRTFTVEDLRFRLGIRADEYADRFNNFKAKVLDKAQEELADTDLRFEMELLREGKAVKHIRFNFNASPLVLEPSATKLPLVAANTLPEREAWATALLAAGIGEAGCEVIRRHLAEGQYPTDYLDYVLEVMRRPRKAAIRKPADYIYKCITGKLLLEEFRRSQEPVAVPKAEKPVRKTTSKPAPAAPAETVYQLAEVREMYDNPGPFSKRSERAPTFEEHLERIYLSQGFVLEKRAGQQVLVLKQGPAQ